MPLTSLLDLELTVPDPNALAAFWTDLGMESTGTATLGTAQRPSQLRLAEGTYRHVSELRLSCESESDLPTIAASLEAIGVSSTITDGSLSCEDPLGDHRVVIEASEPLPLVGPAAEEANRPSGRSRLDRRSAASMATAPPAPRRVGHVVFGTPDLAGSIDFYTKGLGWKVSDMVGPGIGCFMRCSPDHHNMLLMPAPVPCMNHYAMEMDDVDAIGKAGSKIVAERPESQVYGLGRHVLGANLFWYLLDPAGGMFELFADMDQIVDDEHWEAEERRDDWDPFTIASWEPGPATPDFFLPTDIDAIAAAREAMGR